MFIAIIVSVILGAFAARSIIAESDAHRWERPDRWYAPVCVDCGSGLGILLTRCQAHGHPQRRGNTVVLLATIMLSAAVPVAVPSLWLLPAYLVFVWAMILLTVTDLDTKLIPNRILGPATVVAVVFLVSADFADSTGGSLADAAIGGAGYFAVMFLLALIARGGLGFGDVKLAFLIGVLTGYLSLGHVLVSGIGSFLLGGVVAALLLISRKSGRKDAIPFGPFMTAAAMIAIFFGNDIIDWYLR